MSKQKPAKRAMWVLIDKELHDEQLYYTLDGGLYKTKPIPAHKWLKPVRVMVTIAAVEKP